MFAVTVSSCSLFVDGRAEAPFTRSFGRCHPLTRDLYRPSLSFCFKIFQGLRLYNMSFGRCPFKVLWQMSPLPRDLVNCPLMHWKVFKNIWYHGSCLEWGAFFFVLYFERKFSWEFARRWTVSLCVCFRLSVEEGPALPFQLPRGKTTFSRWNHPTTFPSSWWSLSGWWF